MTVIKKISNTADIIRPVKQVGFVGVVDNGKREQLNRDVSQQMVGSVVVQDGADKSRMITNNSSDWDSAGQNGIERNYGEVSILTSSKKISYIEPRIISINHSHYLNAGIQGNSPGDLKSRKNYFDEIYIESKRNNYQNSEGCNALQHADVIDDNLNNNSSKLHNLAKFFRKSGTARYKIKGSEKFFDKPQNNTVETPFKKSIKRRRKPLTGDYGFLFKPFVVSLMGVLLFVGGLSFVGKVWFVKNEVEVKSAQAVGHLNMVKTDLKNKNFNQALIGLKQARDELSEANNQMNHLGGDKLDFLRHFPGLSKISTGKNMVKMGDLMIASVVELAQIKSDLDKAAIYHGGQEAQVSLADVFLQIKDRIKVSRKNLELAEQASKKIKLKDLPSKYQDKVKFIKELLPLVVDNLNDLERSSDVFLELLGVNGHRNFLILLENNQEMRATGGFMGSYGLLETDRGRVKKIKIEGIYNPDGQLTVNVVPPKPIQKISTAWSMHDANWWPDFPTSAKKVEWFYEKTGGVTPDGVLVVTPMLLQRILEITGPVKMPKYNKTITANNFLVMLQSEVEEDYKDRLNNSEKQKIKVDKQEVKTITGMYPNSDNIIDKNLTKKNNNKQLIQDGGINDPKKILADLTPILLKRLSALNDIGKVGKLTKMLLNLLDEKHIVMYFNDKNIQKIVSKQGWSGEVLQTDRDYLMVVNSNINGYKTDGVIDQAIKHQAEIDDQGNIIDTVWITRKHNGGYTPYDWWNKVNADYMRVYVPKGSILLEADGYTREFNEERLDYDKLGFQRDFDVLREEQQMEIDQKTGTRIYEEANKTVFANWVYVSPQEQVTVKYKYKLPFKITLQAKNNNLSRYSLLMQKQIGDTKSRLISEVIFSNKWKVAWLEPKTMEFNKRDNKYIFKHRLNTDQFMGIVFEGKKYSIK